MLHFTVKHQFITESGEKIFVDSNYTLEIAEEIAREKDPTAKYIGIEIFF